MVSCDFDSANLLVPGDLNIDVSGNTQRDLRLAAKHGKNLQRLATARHANALMGHADLPVQAFSRSIFDRSRNPLSF